MHECIRAESPYLQPVPDTCAVENKVCERTGEARNCSHDAGQDCTDHVDPDQHRGHIDRIATHPRNRPIIIGRGHPEHSFN